MTNRDIVEKEPHFMAEEDARRAVAAVYEDSARNKSYAPGDIDSPVSDYERGFRNGLSRAIDLLGDALHQR